MGLQAAAPLGLSRHTIAMKRWLLALALALSTPSLADALESKDPSWLAFKDALFYLKGSPYVFGGTDCSWLVDAALKVAGSGFCSYRRPSFEEDDECFERCDAGPYQSGDVVLLGKHGAGDGDHWVVLSNVNDPRVANSPENTIIDQSSDCGGFCGEAPVRDNLAARKVFACSRPRPLVRRTQTVEADSAPARRASVFKKGAAETLLDGAANVAEGLKR